MTSVVWVRWKNGGMEEKKGGEPTPQKQPNLPSHGTLMVPYEFSNIVVCLFKIFEVARYTQ